MRRALCGPGFAALVLAGCTDASDPELHLVGVVRQNGAVVPGARVTVSDSRGNYIAVVPLGTTTTNDDGTYSLQAPSTRDGYACGGEDNLFLSVEGHEYSTVPSAPIRCTSNTQRVDLTIVDNGLMGL